MSKVEALLTVTQLCRCFILGTPAPHPAVLIDKSGDVWSGTSCFKCQRKTEIEASMVIFGKDKGIHSLCVTRMSCFDTMDVLIREMHGNV